jgi:hypothetical protein
MIAFMMTDTGWVVVCVGGVLFLLGWHRTAVLARRITHVQDTLDQDNQGRTQAHEVAVDLIERAEALRSWLLHTQRMDGVLAVVYARIGVVLGIAGGLSVEWVTTGADDPAFSLFNWFSVPHYGESLNRGAVVVVAAGVLAVGIAFGVQKVVERRDKKAERKAREKLTSDFAAVDFDQSNIAAADQLRVRRARAEHAELYLNHLRIANWIDRSPGAAANIGQHLRQADLLPGAPIYDKFIEVLNSAAENVAEDSSVVEA